MLDQITPVILTWNEEENIGRTLDRLRWAGEVLVVDSGSTDATLDLLRGHKNVRVLQHPFQSHAQQWNFALNDGGITTPWVLALDADYVLPSDFVEELKNLSPEPDVSAYKARFQYWIAGKPIRCGVYPPLPVLFRLGQCEYFQDGHAMRLRTMGQVRDLSAAINHDDRKPFGRWFDDQCRYARLESKKLSNRSWREDSASGRLRRLHVVSPWLVPLYCLTVRGGVLDGGRGFYYAFQRGLAETLISWELLRARLQRLTPGRTAP